MKKLTDTQSKVYAYVLAKFKTGASMTYQSIGDKLKLSGETVRRAVVSLKSIKRKNGHIVGVK